MEEKTYKCHVNRMFVRIPVSSRWRYGYDTVLMYGGIQGNIVHMCDEFGVHGNADALWRSMEMDRTMTPTMFDIDESFDNF